MDLTSLFIRAIDKNGDAYLPYFFDGDFAQEEKAIIESEISAHVPAKVDAMFNNWKISKWGNDYFYAKRATWSEGIAARSACALATKISEYYQRK